MREASESRVLQSNSVSPFYRGFMPLIPSGQHHLLSAQDRLITVSPLFTVTRTPRDRLGPNLLAGTATCSLFF